MVKEQDKFPFVNWEKGTAGEVPETDVKIDQCFTCKLWYEVEVLVFVWIPDQSGWIQKKVCKGCLSEIQKRSKTG